MTDPGYPSDFLNDPQPIVTRSTEDRPLPDMPKKPLRISHLGVEDVSRVIDALGATSAEQADRVLEVVNDLVRSAVRSYENAITWDTTCFNCSNLLDQLYEAEMKLNELREEEG